MVPFSAAVCMPARRLVAKLCSAAAAAVSALWLFGRQGFKYCLQLAI